jgi:hypothetical protein
VTVVIAFANTTDGYLTSTNGAYATARSGGGTLSADTASGVVKVGQRQSGLNYLCYEAFFEFPFTGSATDIVAAAHIDLVVQAAATGTPDRGLEVREFDWGGTLTTADWVPGSTFAGITAYYTSVPLAQQGKAGTTLRGGAEVLRTRVSGSSAVSPLRVVASTNRFRNGLAPSNDETLTLYSADAAGTAQDPCLVYTTVRRSTLGQVGSGHLHQPDGTRSYLLSDGAGTATTGTSTAALTYAFGQASGGAIAQSGTFGTAGSASGQYDITTPGAQAFELVRNSDGDLFVVARSGASSGDVVIYPFLRSGSTWTAKPAQTYTMPAYASRGINNVTATWHKTQSAKGHLMVHTACSAGTGKAAQIAWATFSCSYLLGVTDSAPGTSTLSQASGSTPAWLNLAAGADVTVYPNETGTGLDSASSGSLTGYVASYDSDGYAHGGSYTLDQLGTVTTWTTGARTTLPIAHDADSKLRVLNIDGGRFVIVAGGVVEVRSAQNAVLGSADLTAQGLAAMPTAAALRSTSAWDAVWDPVAGKVWLYYVSTASSITLRRTAFSTITYAGTGEDVSVSAAVGASGSTNVALSAPRVVVTERDVRMRAANVSSGGALSTVDVADGFNVAPAAPVLGSRPNFDATFPATFTWTFSDANTLDAQTQYQLQVQNVSTSVVAYDSGTVSSSAQSATLAANALANGVNYQWRVRTADKSGTFGAYSAYQPLSTAAGGTLTIIDPATDNQAGINTATYLVQFSVSGTTQAKRRVRVIDTVTNAVVTDTGFVSTTSTSVTIGGNPTLASQRQYRVEITAQNASAVSTNTATRLITPNYTYPEVPLLSAVADPDGGRVVVGITNPTPSGDNPEVLTNWVYRRPAGTLTWTRIGIVGNGEAYSDRTVASGQTYDYYVSGQAPASATNSVTATVTAPVLFGVWVHDPLNPDLTARNYLYGGATQTQADTVASTQRQFVGRSYPVYDFGDPQTQTISVSVLVPFGDTWAADLAALTALPNGRRTYCYRDSRSRVVFGTTTGTNQGDVREGTSATFAVARVDYDESV